MWLILFFLGILQIQMSQITPGQVLQLVLSAGSGPVELYYEAAAGEVLTVSARSIGPEALDLTLEILRDGQHITYNDDQASDSSDFAASDALISHLVLAESGSLTLRIYSFNGAQEGEIEVRLDSEPLIGFCTAGPAQLMRNRVYVCQLELQAGQNVSVSARDVSGTLDPGLRLLDGSHEIVAENDDHGSDSLRLDTLDAVIGDLVIAEAGLYRIEVRDFAGQAGIFELALEISP